MKLTKARLKKIIKEEILNEGLKDEYKQFQAEVGAAVPAFDILQPDRAALLEVFKSC